MKNICEHAIVWVKIVAECKEYELLETVAIQDTQDRVFLFIWYLYPYETRPETRKRPKKWADMCEGKIGEPSEDFFDLGFAATVKTYSFSWPVYSSLSLVESLKFPCYCMRHEFGISWKPYVYSKRKRSILRVHHMKLCISQIEASTSPRAYPGHLMLFLPGRAGIWLPLIGGREFDH